MLNATAALITAVLAVILWLVWEPLSILVIVFLVVYAVLEDHKQEKAKQAQTNKDKPS